MTSDLYILTFDLDPDITSAYNLNFLVKSRRGTYGVVYLWCCTCGVVYKWNCTCDVVYLWIVPVT